MGVNARRLADADRLSDKEVCSREREADFHPILVGVSVIFALEDVKVLVELLPLEVEETSDLVGDSSRAMAV